MGNSHYYEVNLVWNSAEQGAFSSPVFSTKIEALASHKISSKPKEKNSDEHLFITAANSCLLTTFLLVADNSNFTFLRFESKAVGKIQEVEDKEIVTEIVLFPILIIPPNHKENKAMRMLQMSEKACPICNSKKTMITIEPTVLHETEYLKT